ncbi:MAG: helix-turn-helix transcriptional regulator [Frankiaceae bacterium]
MAPGGSSEGGGMAGMGDPGGIDGIDGIDGIEALAVLGDPVRRALYAHLRAAGEPVTREAAAAAVGISRALAAFHLDKLVEAGLADATYRRPAGRVVPGRRPKAYVPAAVEIDVTIPPRRYDLLGEILLGTVTGTPEGGSPREHAARLAAERGREIGGRMAGDLRLRRPGTERTLHAAAAALAGLGFEPSAPGRGEVALRNCPFHHFAARDPQFVCGVNVAFVDGLLRGLGNETVEAVLEPVAGECCVRLRDKRAAAPG